MKALSDKDGTPKHRSAASYHLGACQQPGIPLLPVLHAEMEPLLSELVGKVRQVEDAKDARTIVTAVADFVEIGAEDTVRELHEDLAKADRKDPTLGAQKKVFPRGFGPVIDKENEDQFAPLAKLRIDLGPYLSLPAIAADVATLDAQEADLRLKFEAKKTATELVATLEAEEQACRLRVREQLQSAYGRLRDVHKSNPKRAERYFERPSRKPKKSAPTGTPPA